MSELDALYIEYEEYFDSLKEGDVVLSFEEYAKALGWTVLPIHPQEII